MPEARELSAREHEVLLLVLSELTSKEISQKLNLSQRTVDTHRKNIGKKLGTSSVIQWTKIALSYGWI